MENILTQIQLQQRFPTFLPPGTRFVEDNFSTDLWGAGWWVVWDDSSALHLLCVSFLLLLHQLHLRSSGIRSRKLGTPGISDCHRSLCLMDKLMTKMIKKVKCCVPRGRRTFHTQFLTTGAQRLLEQGRQRELQPGD